MHVALRSELECGCFLPFTQKPPYYPENLSPQKKTMNSMWPLTRNYILGFWNIQEPAKSPVYRTVSTHLDTSEDTMCVYSILGATEDGCRVVVILIPRAVATNTKNGEWVQKVSLVSFQYTTAAGSHRIAAGFFLSISKVFWSITVWRQRHSILVPCFADPPPCSGPCLSQDSVTQA